MKHVPVQFESLIRSRKIPVESFLDLVPWTFTPSAFHMDWSLGGMYLELSHHVGGMQTFSSIVCSVSSLCKTETGFKHSLSLFQACVKMKPTSSRVSWFQACVKNETFPILPLVIAILSACFFQMSLGFLTPSSLSAWPIICLHLVVLPIPEEPLRWVVLLASLLTFICFEKFHHYWNQLLPFIPLVPPGGVNFRLFSDSLNMKILPSRLSFWSR